MTIEDYVKNIATKAKQGAYGYAIDTGIALSFYQPLMASYEAAQGMPFEAIVKTRAAGAVSSAVLGGALGKCRNAMMRITHTTNESSKFKKIGMEALTQFLFQGPIYAGMLYASGIEPEKIPTIALPGLALCVATGPVYGKYQDYARNKLGVSPAITQATRTTD